MTHSDRPIEPVLARLAVTPKRPQKTKLGFTWRAKCPAHDDQKASLAVTEATDGTVLLKCFAGCDREAILAKLDLTFADLYPRSRRSAPGKTDRIVTTYEYTDADGVVLYEVVRFEPKMFRLRGPNGEWGIGDAPRVLYRLPQLIEDIGMERRVYLVEGEKDADALVLLGLSATTHIGGAGGWRDQYVPYFAGADVVFLPDNDRPGREHAHRVAAAIVPIARSVRVLMLPNLPPKGDVSDWLSQGGTREALERLASDAPLWHPKARLRPPTKLANAIGLLRAELAGGPKPSRLVFTRAREAGLSERTIQRAVAKLGVHSSAQRSEAGMFIEWFWELPAEDAADRSDERAA